jgi:hypothetical protein
MAGNQGVRTPLNPIVLFALVIEAVLSVAALYAGYLMVREPDGSLMQMPTSWLAGTPFPDYLVPGIMLIAFNGLFPLVVIALALRHHVWALPAMMLSGVLLVGWLSIQLALLQMWHPVMHPTLFVAGALLIGIGYWEWRREGRPGFAPLRGLRGT